MKKIILFLCAAIAAPAFSSEAICAPNFEIIGMNADLGKSSIKVLQGSMETKMNSRQLVIPLAEDSISTTDSESSQIAWAKSRNCSYLLQTSLTRLGETVQVSGRLMDLSSNLYVFKKAYKAATPDDLHPIFQQMGNTLQDPKFASFETIYDVTDASAKSLTKKRSSTYWGLAVGASYYKEMKDMYGFGLGYTWDARVIIGEMVWNLGFGSISHMQELGIHVLYPFTDRSHTPYIGGGAGLAFTAYEKEIGIDTWGYTYNETETNYGLLLEASLGYLVGRTGDLIFRIEAYGDFLLKGKTMGGGARLMLGID